MIECVCEIVTEHELIGDVHQYERRELIVRCRECARSSRDGARMTCDHPRCLGRMMAEPDGFCKWGERRSA